MYMYMYTSISAHTCTCILEYLMFTLITTDYLFLDSILAYSILMYIWLCQRDRLSDPGPSRHHCNGCSTCIVTCEYVNLCKFLHNTCTIYRMYMYMYTCSHIIFTILCTYILYVISVSKYMYMYIVVIVFTLGVTVNLLVHVHVNLLPIQVLDFIANKQMYMCICMHRTTNVSLLNQYQLYAFYNLT